MVSPQKQLLFEVLVEGETRLDVAPDQCYDLFNEEAEVEVKTVMDSNGTCTAGIELLSQILWNQSVPAMRNTNEKGKIKLDTTPS